MPQAFCRTNIYAYVNGNPVNRIDPRGLFALPLAIPIGQALVDAATIIFGGAIIYNNATEVPIKDLDPLHSPETIGNRPDIEGLSDEDLLDAARNPGNGERITVNTKTGKLVQGKSVSRKRR